jgi:hypothetical protein
VPAPQRPDYHKWTRFYLDFCHKYGHLARSPTRLGPFLGKLAAKPKICLQELRESHRWLLLIQRVPLLRPRLVDPLAKETEELVRIFVRSIQTAEERKQ